ncbi:hypothetical protein HYC85_014714 [Camellia sinensis]|uniref:Uncharacterized protein n=1 Tax=Camellia sinensis TaxID=4442 RepID=A0A7J7H865_CAMSI|nr:hypothetical protein HYC85_014714 [Camellia sinensis]
MLDELFAGEEEDSDLSDNFIVKTCRKFIPVTCIVYFVAQDPHLLSFFLDIAANYDGNRFITIQDGVWKATPLLLTVAVIELSDIAFAVGSLCPCPCNSWSSFYIAHHWKLAKENS